MHRNRFILSAFLLPFLFFSLALTACGEDDGNEKKKKEDPIEEKLDPVVAQGPALLTNTSADDYAHNRWGLIEAETLEAFVNHWVDVDTADADAVPNGRPTHLPEDSRLVILQLNGANRAEGENYIPSSPEDGVYVFEIDEFRFNEARDTGLISNSVPYQASGPVTDQWLGRYGIDLRRDYVVFAAGENTNPNGAFFQELGRAIYWLSYWGADLEQLAVVNGTLGQNYEGELSNSVLSEGTITNDDFTVRQIRLDNTSLTLPLEDLLQIVDDELQAKGLIDGFDKQFIIDARPTSQFLRTDANASFAESHPGQFITTAWDSAGPPSQDEEGRDKTYVLAEGHIKGATSFPWASLLEDVGENNWKYRSKDELAGIFADAGYTAERAQDTVIVSQCRTNYEVQVNGFASRVVLGYPTVHFDGSLIEFLSVVSNHPNEEFNLKPEDPAYKYRTDIPTRLQHYAVDEDNDEAPLTTEDDEGVAAYNVPGGEGALERKVSQATVNPNATTTRKALDEDQAYKDIESLD